MKNKKYNELITGFVFGGCLLLYQPAYAVKKTFLCRNLFVNSLVAHIETNLYKSKNKSKQDFTPLQYVFGPVLESNDITSIQQALNVDGAAIVNINTFTREIAEKMRQAIHEASSKNSKLPFFKQKKPDYFYFNPEGKHFVPELSFVPKNKLLEKDWRDFKEWLESKTQIISSEEIGQFQTEVNEYIAQIKQMILEVDKQEVELDSFYIRTEKGRFEPGHKHYELGRLPLRRYNPKYITVSISPIGLSTFYTKPLDTTRKRMISDLGHTVVLSERDRIRKMKKPRSLPFHGTPNIFKERLFLLFLFRIPMQ